MKKSYAYPKPENLGLEKIAKLRNAFSDLHILIRDLAPESWERSVTLTNLESTAMWATKSIVCNDPGSITKAGDELFKLRLENTRLKTELEAANHALKSRERENEHN